LKEQGKDGVPTKYAKQAKKGSFKKTFTYPEGETVFFWKLFVGSLLSFNFLKTIKFSKISG
jgi:hypothetical protein